MWFDVSRSQEAIDYLKDLEARRDELREAIDEGEGDTEEYEMELEDVLSEIDEAMEIVEEHNRIFREEEIRAYWAAV